MASGGRTGLTSGPTEVSCDSAQRAAARRLRLLLKAVARDTEVCEGMLRQFNLMQMVSDAMAPCECMT